MPAWASLAVLLALVLEWTFREPPERLHPVAWLGRLVAPLDREWRYSGASGLLVALAVPVLVGGVVYLSVALAGIAHVALASLLAGLVLFSASSLRMLTESASEVAEASENDPERAREALLALVGRERDDLSSGEMRSAAVESCAENLADGLVAPLLAFGVVANVSLPFAAAAAAWVKAVNTLDSMLGYPDKPHGTACAWLDDLVMVVPARVAAVLLSLAARSPDPLLNARRWAGEPASPNSGWPMGTLAGALYVRLEKPGAYVLNPVADLPTVADARKGVRLVTIAGLLAYLLAGVLAWG
ncbi:CobD/CbiB family cobalamin biosynthesis protein [Natronorarus salvus]|uniref:CobD/CbiB family cobalamin biosynthesis protein n=1 Tax=Natronorarus salvus TaxID=3117733 RepID=UPI002F26613C